MAEQGKSDTQAPPEMDYPEHERTYSLFLTITKWGTIATVAVLIAMAFGFFAGGGLFGGTLVFVLLLAVSWFIL